MKIHFLGTNGWFDTHETGSTMCTLLETKEAYIVFDVGFGVHKLDKYIKDDRPIYFFISHFHIDHICGFHVMPKFSFKQKVIIVYQDDPSSRAAFKSLTSHPFCASLEQYKFPVEVMKVKPGGHTKPIEFECLPLSHADPCLGYRLYVEGKVIVYCSDTAPCDNDIRLAQGADVLLHECALSPGRSDSKWGHSSPEGAAEVAKKAGVKKLVLTHFAASGYTSFGKRRSGKRAAKKIFSNTVVAKDGFTITV
jgi:ribonuclease BN (tRNA processing enzyme)